MAGFEVPIIDFDGHCYEPDEIVDAIVCQAGDAWGYVTGEDPIAAGGQRV